MINDVMMNDEIKIETLYKYYCRSKEQVSLESLIEFMNLIQNISAELRQKCAFKLSRIMVEQLKKLNQWPETSNTLEGKLLVNTIEILSVAQMENTQRDTYQECLRFINDLRDLRKISGNSADKVVEQSRMFWDILPDIKEIFSLKTSTGDRAYPIHELVLDAANCFKHDNEHLITLALALQLFESVKNLEEIQEEASIQKKVSDIAKSFQIRFLEIISEGGRLLLDSLDYQYNGTIRAVSRDRKRVIIRNIRKEYFSMFDPKQVKFEADYVAWYIECELSGEEELSSFQEVFGNGSKENRLNLLKYIAEQQIYNIFLPDMLVRNRASEKFIRVLNPCSGADKYIISGKNTESANMQGFLKILKTGKNNNRALFLCEDGIDVLTVDYYCSFYLEVVKGRWNLWTDFTNDDFYQRQLSSSFLLEMFKKQDIREFAKTLSDYYIFLKNYVPYAERNAVTKMDSHMCLMMPYGCCLPKDINEEKCKQKILQQWFSDEVGDWCCEELNYNKQTQGMVTNTGESLEDYIFYSEDDFDKPIHPVATKLKFQKYYFVNHKKQKIIEDGITSDVMKRISGIRKLARDEIITFERKYDYAIENINRLQAIMEKNVLKQEMYGMFGCEKGEKEKEKCVRLFKILWHFQIYDIRNERLKDFWKLVFEKHYLGCVEQDEKIEAYFEELRNEANKNGILVVAKETSGDDTTLWNLYNSFGKKGGAKDLLVKAFSSDSINGDLKENGKSGYCWRTHSLKKIIFMVDNTLSGSSLKKMLAFHINGVCPKTKYKYVDIKPTLKEMLEKDRNIIVEVHIIFALLSEEIKLSIEEQFGNISLVIYNQIPEKYKVDSETVNLIKKLYNIDSNMTGGFIFRYSNMPAKYAFPKEVVESLNLVGLFQRRNEI